MTPVYDQNPERVLGIPPLITSVEDALGVHDALKTYRAKLQFSAGIDSQPHYRGEQKFGWDIAPGIFRGPGASLSGPEAKDLEARLVAEFDKEITSRYGQGALRHLFDGQAHGRAWDGLFEAQHAGIRTTVLDFSFRPERSLFFAVEEHSDPAIEASDAQFWAFQYDNQKLLSHQEYPIGDSYYDQDPQQLEQGKMINVPFFADQMQDRLFEGRRFKQVGRFFIPARDICQVPLNHQEDITPHLFRFRIPAESKKHIREQLAADGISREFLYVAENPEHNNLVREINKRICGW